MINVIVKILILIFISAILMLLASYSTVFKARAKRTALVYEIVAGILIVSDSNLVLGVAEFVIFQVMVIFSAIASLYAYAGIKISEKKDPEESTALIVLPVKKQEVEVDMDTVDSMQNLTYSVFCICLGVLILIRPALLFPFYGKNWALFTVSLLIVTLNFWIASIRSMPRAADSISKEIDCTSTSSDYYANLTMMSLLAFIIVQVITAIIFLVLDEDTQKNVTTQIPTYSVMSPISERYDYKEDLPSYKRDHIVEIDDNIYLIKYGYYNDDRYYLNLGDPDLLCITDTGSWQKVSIHVKSYDGPYNTPCVKKTEKTYTNLRGETKVSETIYDIYIQDEEQILTY